MIGYINPRPFLGSLDRHTLLRGDPESADFSRIFSSVFVPSVWIFFFGKEGRESMRLWVWVVAAVAWMTAAAAHRGGGEQPLSRIALERTTLAVDDAAHVQASPTVLGLDGEDRKWVEVEFFHPNPSGDDWIGVFSPANFRYTTFRPCNISPTFTVYM
jgi:hypothetical protein